MPYEDPDSTDPLALHGVVVEADSDEPMVEMAKCFVEEYARLGFDAERIQCLFHAQEYAGPNMALRALGEHRIHELIAEAVALRGPRHFRDTCRTTSSTGISLPVLETDR